MLSPRLTTLFLRDSLRPMKEAIYSIRMHASQNSNHVSGAERLCNKADLQELAAAMVSRALNHSKGSADSLRISVDRVKAEDVAGGSLPDITTIEVSDYEQGRRAASGMLLEFGVSSEAVKTTLEALARGAAPGGLAMRGAMLVDAITGERLEQDQARGVRATRMGLTAEAESTLRAALQGCGLDNVHVREALVLAAKVLAAPGVIAELCWSDDPEYTAGYVTSPERGYLRFPHLKPLGETKGGRAFFLSPGADIERVISFLESQVMLFDGIGKLHPDIKWED